MSISPQRGQPASPMSVPEGPDRGPGPRPEGSLATSIRPFVQAALPRVVRLAEVYSGASPPSPCAAAAGLRRGVGAGYRVSLFPRLDDQQAALDARSSPGDPACRTAARDCGGSPSRSSTWPGPGVRPGRTRRSRRASTRPHRPSRPQANSQMPNSFFMDYSFRMGWRARLLAGHKGEDTFPFSASVWPHRQDGEAIGASDRMASIRLDRADSRRRHDRRLRARMTSRSTNRVRAVWSRVGL